jgi:hypothetical protein
MSVVRWRVAIAAMGIGGLVGCGSQSEQHCLPTPPAAAAVPVSGSASAEVYWDGSGSMARLSGPDSVLQKLLSIEATVFPAANVLRYQNFIVSDHLEPVVKLPAVFRPSAPWTNLALVAQQIAGSLTKQDGPDLILLVSDMVVDTPPTVRAGSLACDATVPGQSQSPQLPGACFGDALRHAGVPSLRPSVSVVRFDGPNGPLFVMVFSRRADLAANAVHRLQAFATTPDAVATVRLAEPPEPSQVHVGPCVFDADSSGLVLMARAPSPADQPMCRFRNRGGESLVSTNCTLRYDAPEGVIVHDGIAEVDVTPAGRAYVAAGAGYGRIEIGHAIGPDDQHPASTAVSLAPKLRVAFDDQAAEVTLTEFGRSGVVGLMLLGWSRELATMPVAQPLASTIVIDGW